MKSILKIMLALVLLIAIITNLSAAIFVAAFLQWYWCALIYAGALISIAVLISGKLDHFLKLSDN